MSEVLYRKYRPQSFKDVIGQDHVVDVLSQAVKLGNIAHAYLFSGSRGTGKTSVARILSREIGCSQNDLYEIDAASNRGIDDIREIRDGVNVLPFESPYKVYIVDEVHMLTKEAFNALLKTLEEPPKHAVFILATTDLDKVPETIVSRCQTFVFKKPTQIILKSMLSAVAKKEGLKLGAGVAELVALLADGSFRDAQGILQKVASASKDKTISLEEVERATGTPTSQIIKDIVLSIATKDAERGLEAVRKASDKNVDMGVLLTLVLRMVRAILLLAYAPAMKSYFVEDFSAEDMSEMENIAKQKDIGLSSETLLELLAVSRYIRTAPIASLPLELAIIKLTGKK